MAHRPRFTHGGRIPTRPDRFVTYYRVRLVWLGEREEIRAFAASTLSEAFTMAERSWASVPNGPDTFGVLPDDYARARAEEIRFNEADGLLTD